MRITLVKKIKADGSPCRKCAEVVERLERSQLLARIDRVVVADERDPDSEGMQLAGKYNIDGPRSSSLRTTPGANVSIPGSSASSKRC